MEEIRKILRLIEDRGLYPEAKVISSAPTPEVMIRGKRVISFCSNNYLGLSVHPRVIEASIEAIRKYGTGSGSARWGSGTFKIHEELEKVIADFKRTEDAMVFSAGYMVNIGVIPAVMNLINFGPLSVFKSKGVILSDALNHASIIDGCKLSRAKVVVYKHKDMKDLEAKLKRYRRKRKLIVTDGVFSMDGDIAPLPQIVELAKKYNAMVMVDDAHATGVLGENGRGTAEHFHLEEEVDILMGTFSKALGAVGGYIAGDKDLIKFLRISARSYVFSAAMPPGVAGGLIAAFKEIQNNPGLRRKLWENASHLREGLKERGFDTLDSETPIVPVLIGKEEDAIKVSNLLFERGFFAFCVRWPAVPKGKARIRFTAMALHTEEQIEALLREMEKIGKEIGII